MANMEKEKIEKIEKIKRKKRKSKRTPEKPKNFDYNSLPIKEFQKIGELKDHVTYTTKAGLRSRITYPVIMNSAMIIKCCLVLIILSAMGSIYFMNTKPEPILLLSYPDGTVVCPSLNYDIKTGNYIPREKEYVEMCNDLDRENNGGKS